MSKKIIKAKIIKENTDIIMYVSQDGKVKIQANIDPNNNTVWLNQDKIAKLFDRDRTVITKHIKEILEDGELDEKSNVHFLHIALSDKPVKVYSLDVILAVGYRVKSNRGIQFRRFATDILHEYIQKGFSMNDELLKNAGGGNYFRELLDRIRDIRSSEKVFYRQVLDIYATAVDYDPNTATALKFFEIVQNKMHYAVHGMTAPEMIVARANAELPFMGLSAFKGEKPIKSEITTAKNYLSKDEIDTLKLITSLYLDFAELQAKSNIPMTMKEWIDKLDEFLKLSRKEVLTHAGTISRENADEHAELEYTKYKAKSKDELTPVEQAYLKTIHETYRLLENKKK